MLYGKELNAGNCKHGSDLRKCEGCPYGGPKVGSRGNLEAPIVFIAEAPGLQEIRQQVPLVGPSGKVFWETLPKQLEEMGLDPEDFLILNALQCVPPRGKDAAKNTALIAKGRTICNNRLMEQIRLHPRKLIVAMGNHAMHAATGNPGLKITQERGRIIRSPLAEIGILPAVHPAALLRGTGNYRQFKMDIHYAIALLKHGRNAEKHPIKTRRIVVETPQLARLVINLLKTKPIVAADTETSGFSRVSDRMLCLGMAYKPEIVYIFTPSVIPLVNRLFVESKGITKFAWHNGKFDMGFMRRGGCPDARVDEDTMLESYALDESGGIHDLEQVAGDLLGAPDYKYMVKPFLKNKATSYSVIPKPVLYDYLALDVSSTLQVHNILRPMIAEDKVLEKLYTRVLIPASETLYQCEDRGLLLHLGRVNHQKKRLEAEVKKELEAIQVVARKYGATSSVNPNSSLQICNLLFDVLRMRIPPGQKRSSAKEVIERLPPHPVLKALAAHRKAAKALSTYVTSLLDKSMEADGAVHASYLIHGTRTGRLSSRGPNMQNIPRDKRIRGMYRARPGYVFIKVDLNQAELRSLAALSGDRFLVELYKDGKRSLHKETAADPLFYGERWHTTSEPQKGEELMRAKAVNFGIVYGREAPSLAEEFSEPVAKMQGFITAWAKRSPGAWSFIQKCRTAPAKGLTLVTPFGRKKRHWLVTQENLHAMQNEASNMPHQSIASDINLVGAGICAPLLRKRDVWLVNLVHDEAMFECPDNAETIEWAKNLIISTMEQVPIDWGITQVPFKAEADIGRRWSIYRKPTKVFIVKEQSDVKQVA